MCPRTLKNLFSQFPTNKLVKPFPEGSWILSRYESNRSFPLVFCRKSLNPSGRKNPRSSCVYYVIRMSYLVKNIPATMILTRSTFKSIPSNPFQPRKRLSPPWNGYYWALRAFLLGGSIVSPVIPNDEGTFNFFPRVYRKTRELIVIWSIRNYGHVPARHWSSLADLISRR